MLLSLSFLAENTTLLTSIKLSQAETYTASSVIGEQRTEVTKIIS
jgi:hypothetical protein